VKICLSANRFPPNVVGGSEVIVHQLALQLKARGHEVSILTLSDSRSGSRTKVDGLDVRMLPNVNVYNQFAHEARGGVKKALFGVIDNFNPLVFVLAWRQLKSLGPDVLCTNTLKGMGPAVWLAAWMRRVPVVHVNHDYWLVCPRSTLFANGKACTAACKGCRSVSRPKAWFSRLVGHVVSVSRFVRARHDEYKVFPHARHVVIHNSRPLMSAQVPVPHKPSMPLRIGFIGRTDATKGIAEFFASVDAARLAGLKVHIAGRDNDNELAALRLRYPHLDVVHHGFVDSRVFYESVDLVVVTSMWDEPFGMVAIEPWEFHKPSVAFASGGLAEVFERLPELLVPRGDTAALGALIRRLATDTAFYLESARRCHAEREHFLPARQVRELERVLVSAATARRGDRGVPATLDAAADIDVPEN
jgi:glycogen synthase